MTSTDREILLEINGRLMRLETRVGKIESRVERVESGFIHMDKRLSVIEGKFDVMLWAIALGFALLSVLVTYMGIRQPKEKPDVKIQPEIIPSQPTITLEAVECIAGIIRGQASSIPSKDTPASPSSTANS